MGYRIQSRQADSVTDRDAGVYHLLGPDGDEAEIWPALGFNVFRWRPVRNHVASECLYADPELFTGGRPTRSGIPVLFPFPNRIREGHFVWAGQTYSLIPNDPAMRNAIHGFACRTAWRIVNCGSDADSAWITGVFRGSIDGGWTPEQWPADHEIELTVRLSRGTLRLEAVIRNPDSVPLPFGLGYHPYFRADDATQVQVPANRFWCLSENIPSGETREVDSARDLNHLRKLGDLKLDDILTALPSPSARPDGLIERAIVRGPLTVRLACSPVFREMVVFTPPHRQAFCIEPYTCTTDAVNLDARGMDAGWLTLPPGGEWITVVEFSV